MTSVALKNINSDEAKSEELTTTNGLKTISKLCLKPIIGNIFHPVYMMVNAAVCGRLGEKYLAGFGLGSLTLGIMAISVGCMFAISGTRTLIA